jgi:hypothetical protein
MNMEAVIVHLIVGVVVFLLLCLMDIEIDE